ncbi:manganese peroxidase [Moniliophthora roreri MCA 2997]|uniref:Peroxidase n=1 Tax=Moniliophthora roreri (strain MCA 2997) TaxID=1381753 RepID=V2XFZ2_MONRO|nr:manganese peroxidase [Moniliophthora roreri MCA 2997]
MQFKNLLTLLPFVIVANAGPFSKRADCSKGRSAEHAECCVWYDVLDDLQSDIFVKEPCGETVHESLRLSFHDAIGYSPRLFAQGEFGGGGADGSIIQHADVEFRYSGNRGLEDIVERLTPLGPRYQVAYGDLIQFAAAVGITQCPGAPRLEFLAGRNKTSQASPDLLPSPADPVDKIFDRLGDAGFSPDEVIDLLISHTIGGQEHVDESTPNTPFDTTPETFDSQFFVETLLKGTVQPPNGTQPGAALPPLRGAFRLASDAALARDPRTSCRWQSYITDQSTMQTRFRDAMSKLALLGQKRENLVDCSEIIPTPKTLTSKPFLPAGKSMKDIEPACSATPFPVLTAQSGRFFPFLRADGVLLMVCGIIGRETAVHPETLSVTLLNARALPTAV